MKYNNFYSILLVLSGLSSFLFTPSSSLASDNIGELKIPASIVTGAINSQLKGAKIRLNNYGPQRGKSWYKGGDSYVKIPGLSRVSLGDIDAINFTPFRYYINDINLSSFNVSTKNNKFLIRFYFESNGAEIKGRCASKNWAKNKLCIKGSDNTAPDIQVNNAIASVYLTPAIRHGSVSYSSVSADFDASIRVGKTCEKIGCNRVINYKNKIKKAIRGQLRKALDNNTLRNRISNSAKKAFKQLKINRIVYAKIQGNSILIRFEIKS